MPRRHELILLPEFSPEPGFVEPGTRVTLDPGSNLYYTTNGDTPNGSKGMGFGATTALRNNGGFPTIFFQFNEGGDDWWRRFWQLVLATTVLTVAIDFLEVPIQGLVFVLIVAIVASEVVLSRRGDRASLGFFGLAIALITAGSVFSVLDVTRTWCDPGHPFLQGHAIWHCLSALSLLAAFFHFRQFETLLSEPAA